MNKLKTNVFYHGDCLFVMKHDIPAESIDLIYLDPPFFTGQVQKPKSPEKAAEKYDWNPAAMQMTYDDSKEFWLKQEIRDNAPIWLLDIAKREPKSYYESFGRYLYYMRERLYECKRVLKSSGSIYLHCDWRASHYLKIIMDEIFGINNFRNEIVWRYRRWTAASKMFQRMHDTIFFYTKTDKYKFNKQYEPFSEKTQIAQYKRKVVNGSVIQDKESLMTRDPSQGVSMHDVWEIPYIHPMSKERTGYPTQKPRELLKRIIKASTNDEANTDNNEDIVVLDPFCGCGSTVIAAHELNRKWIGIDINETAFKVIMEDAYKKSKMNNIQTTFDGFVKPKIIERTIENIVKMSGYEFEKWVNELYSATKPSPDKGVDGIIPEGIPIQVKTYKVGYDIVGQFLNDIKYHPAVSNDTKRGIIVSSKGFDSSAIKRVFDIKEREDYIIELITPEDLLKVK